MCKVIKQFTRLHPRFSVEDNPVDVLEVPARDIREDNDSSSMPTSHTQFTHTLYVCHGAS